MNYKFGQVAIIGKTNVGKSTLLNRLIGEKVSIVSPKAQTTRNNVLGLLTNEKAQIAFVDTPGIHRGNSALSKYMNKNISVSVLEVDVIVYVLDGTKPFKETDLDAVGEYLKIGSPVIVVISKVDLADKEKLVLQMQRLNDLKVASVVPLSALKNKNVEPLVEEIIKLLPEGEKMYEDDYLTDKPLSFIVAERIREKVLLFFNAEIPHGVTVTINTFEYDEKKNLYSVNADIVCEKQNHKGMLIGKGGEALKRVGSSARIDLETFLDAKVFLELYVKVKEDWRNSEKLMAQLGYNSKEFDVKD